MDRQRPGGVCPLQPHGKPGARRVVVRPEIIRELCPGAVREPEIPIVGPAPRPDVDMPDLGTPDILLVVQTGRSVDDEVLLIGRLVAPGEEDPGGVPPPVKRESGHDSPHAENVCLCAQTDTPVMLCASSRFSTATLTFRHEIGKYMCCSVETPLSFRSTIPVSTGVSA